MKSRPLILAAAVASTLAVAAGCGAGSSGGNSARPASAQQELNQAFTSLGKANTLTTTIKLAMTPAQLVALSRQGNGTPLTASQATKISAAQVVVENQAPSGKTIGDLAQQQAGTSAGSTQFTILDAGHPYVQVASVHQVSYIHADLRGVLALFNKQRLFGSVAARVKSLPPFVQAFVAGKWISLPDSTLKSLEGLATSSQGIQTPNPTQRKQLLTDLQQVLVKDVTTTYVSKGTTDHLLLTADSRKLIVDVLHTIATVVPGIGSRLAGATPQSIPQRQIHLDAYVTNNSLSALSLDLGQFANKQPQPHAPLTISFARSGPAITAPTGAVPVNTSQLSSLIGAFAGGSSNP